MGLIRIAGYPMDLAMREVHSFPGEATRFKVEDGSDISDHITDLPAEIELECIVSDKPTGEIASDPTRQQAGADVALPSADALARLRELKAARRPVTIETSLGAFAVMAFIHLDVPVDVDKNNALFFTAKFQQLTLVQNRRTKIRVKIPHSATAAQTQSASGKPIPVNRAILWQHGVPPGQPWKPGNPVETVTSSYTPTAGQTHEEIVEFRRGTPASGAITYTDAKGAVIFGARRAALVADLQRNEAKVQAAEAKDAKARTDELHDKLQRAGALPPKTSSINRFGLPGNAGL